MPAPSGGLVSRPSQSAAHLAAGGAPPGPPRSPGRCTSYRGGESSRNVGRHLAARGLLTALKARYSGLFHFLQAKPETFALDLNKRGDDKSGLEYYVRLEQGGTKEDAEEDAEEAETAEVER